jgi:hypothetical protein
MLHRVEVRVVQVNRKASSWRIVCSQYRRCQMSRSPRLVRAGDRGSRAGKAFENAVLIARQRPGKSPSPAGQGPQAVHMVGKDDPGVDAEGRVAPHLPNSVPLCLNLRHQQVRATVEQVDREEERSTRNPIAAIVRHAREYALKNGGMRFRFSALRLLFGRPRASRSFRYRPPDPAPDRRRRCAIDLRRLRPRSGGGALRDLASPSNPRGYRGLHQRLYFRTL